MQARRQNRFGREVATPVHRHGRAGQPDRVPRRDAAAFYRDGPDVAERNVPSDQPALAVSREQRIASRGIERVHRHVIRVCEICGLRLLENHPERLGRRLVEATLFVVDAHHVLELAPGGREARDGGLPLGEAIGSDLDDVQWLRPKRLAAVEDPDLRPLDEVRVVVVGLEEERRSGAEAVRRRLERERGRLRRDA